MLARDVMTAKVHTITPTTAIEDVARLLLERSISAVPVVDEDRHILGIVSEGDLIRRAEADTYRRPSWWLELLADHATLARDYLKTHGRTAKDVMTRQVISVTEDTPVAKIADLLESRRIKRVPVVRDGKLVGVVSRADLLRALAQGPRAGEGPADDKAIRETLLSRMRAEPWVAMLFVNVVVEDGVVQLWGQVDSEDEKRALELLAQNVPGVKAVDNHLGVKPIASYAE